jgi:hypothetical protein
VIRVYSSNAISYLEIQGFGQRTKPGQKSKFPDVTEYFREDPAKSGQSPENPASRARSTPSPTTTPNTTPEVSPAAEPRRRKSGTIIWSDEQCAAFLKSLKWNPTGRAGIEESQAAAILEIDCMALPDDDTDPETLAGVAARLAQFEISWVPFWRKVSKKVAREAWFKATAEWSVLEDIQRALEAQTPGMLAREPHNRPHMATWLNQHRWTDEVERPPDAPRASAWAN